ncbi:MAG: alpha/beta hydrolase [Acetobacteraceae bacterium]|nr:alpha/beta hydrolase [Acetobacteraceae bacterium]MDW8399735.1 alpha/beta hydrolase [Acetobacteraceae bacterium]
MSIAPPPGLVPPGTRPLPAGRGALFLAAGAGPPVLCIPGGHHGAWCFAALLAALGAAGLAAGAVELRGKGTLSAAADPAAGIEDYAEDVLAAARLCGAAPVLVGHSLGALVALRAALRLPRLSGLVLLAPSPPGNLPGVALLPELPEGRLVPPPDEAAAAARFLGGERPPGLSAYAAALDPESPRALNERYRGRLPVEPAALASVPVLVIEAGREDAARHPPGQDAALARFLGGEHRLLPRSPHCLMLAPWLAALCDPLLPWLRARAA